jgi:hypothetical protein
MDAPFDKYDTKFIIFVICCETRFFDALLLKEFPRGTTYA